MVLLKQTTLGLLLGSLVAGIPVDEGGVLIPRQTQACAPIHLLVARGTTEAPGDGQLGTLAQNIIRANPGATQEAIDYPASVPYGSSVSQGTTAVKNQLTAYVQRCPNAKIVLMGYSQGAQVVGDALCGGDAAGTGPVTPPVDTAISSHVSAIVWYGDPRNVAGKSFDKGTATRSGLYARPANQSCDSFSNQIASYCDNGDPYCASGQQVQVHLTYPQRYNNAALQFVNSKLT